MNASRLSSVPHARRRGSPNSTAHRPGSRSLSPQAVALLREVQSAIGRTGDWLLAEQHQDGYWVGELEGDSILESEFLLLWTYLGRENSDLARMVARCLLESQMPGGGWSLYPGGPVDVSASVKAYFALKIAGYDPASEPLRRARAAVLAHGGAERCNSFTRFYLALLGQIHYDACPAVPPEIVLLPRWAPVNIYAMSAWTRTIVVPLSILWAYRPVRSLPEAMGIGELFRGQQGSRSADPEPPAPNPEPSLDSRSSGWDAFFLAIDQSLKQLERWGVRPLRQRAIRAAERWMLQRFQDSDGLGAIFPPMVWTVVALKCLGYAEHSTQVQWALKQLEGLIVQEGDRAWLQPCLSPVWDTAISMLALREAGVPHDDASLRRGANWLLDKEVRAPGDWAVGRRNPEPGGWFFEFHNRFYPDVDDTAMVVMALARCLDLESARSRWKGAGESVASGLFPLLTLYGRTAERSGGRGRGSDWGQRSGIFDPNPSPTLDPRPPTSLCREADHLPRNMADAVERGVRWILGMQNSDGGWAAFDRDNNRDFLTRVPFADHNAMIDPSSADITARVLEMLGMLGARLGHPRIDRAINYLLATQEPDGSWYGRWGVNYVYGTWQALLGLTRIGLPADHPRVGQACRWLQSCQHHSGAWGESCRSYDDPSTKGRGEPTASQTAWALMGLIAAGRHDSRAVQRGVRWLIDTQRRDGTWAEHQFTGTGFPRVFYLKYHLYRVYFPLLALARYVKATAGAVGDARAASVGGRVAAG